MSVLIYFAIPFFGFAIALELLAMRRRGRRGEPGAKRLVGYEWRDSAASIAMGTGNVALSALAKGWMAVPAFWLQPYAFWEIPNVWWAWLLVIPAEDFCYYWFHRVHHEVRFCWAAHVNHHSSQRYNLSTALRQSWTTMFTGPVFWLPLVLIGFDPLMILGAQGISLLYQFWIHTELIDRLGPLEAIMNTPSHHRVHHGRNLEYLDRNYAGIFIVWDRLFGSFEVERATVDYGITKNIESYNLLTIAFHEWRAMLRDARRAPNVSVAIQTLLQPPGWSADGSSHTARERRDARRLGRGEGVAA